MTFCITESGVPVAQHKPHDLALQRCVKATEAIKQNWPDLYLFDPTPIAQATWRVGSECVAIVGKGDEYVFSNLTFAKVIARERGQREKY